MRKVLNESLKVHKQEKLLEWLCRTQRGISYWDCEYYFTDHGGMGSAREAKPLAEVNLQLLGLSRTSGKHSRLGQVVPGPFARTLTL